MLFQMKLLNLYTTIALFILIMIIINTQVTLLKKIETIQIILEENLLPPLPEWEEPLN